MEITNADRVVFPESGVTKGEVVAYYQSVSAVMLPHLAGRPLTLERYPRGIGEKGFMQKQAAPHFPAFVGRVEVPKAGEPSSIPWPTARKRCSFSPIRERSPSTSGLRRCLTSTGPTG